MGKKDEKVYELEVAAKGDIIDIYEELLSRYDEWKEFKREVRLTGLLNSGKRIQFDVDDANFFLYTGTDAIRFIRDAAFRADNISFIMKDETIESMTIKGHPIKNTIGECVKGILDAEVKLMVRRIINDDGKARIYIDIEEDKAA